MNNDTPSKMEDKSGEEYSNPAKLMEKRVD